MNMSGQSIEYSQKELLSEIKTDLQRSQAVLKTDLRASQAAMKTDLQASQAALKTDLQASQATLEERLERFLLAMKTYLQASEAALKTDLQRSMDAQAYKLIISLSPIVMGSLSLFESLGVYIQYPWRIFDQAIRTNP